MFIIMGQQEICDFLEENPDEWYSTRDLSEAIDKSIGSVTVCLKKLRENNEVDYKPSGKKGGKRLQYLYKKKK